jgi:hypothetical protein
MANLKHSDIHPKESIETIRTSARVGGETADILNGI